MIANTAMRRLLSGNPGAAEVSVPSQFRLLLAGGIKPVEGCHFLRDFFLGHNYATALPHYGDATGYECAVNSLHIEDYLAAGAAREPVALALTGRECALFLAAKLREYGATLAEPTSFRIIVTVDGRSSTIRFHAIREGESWLAEDLEADKSPVFVHDTSDASGELQP